MPKQAIAYSLALYRNTIANRKNIRSIGNSSNNNIQVLTNYDITSTIFDFRLYLILLLLLENNIAEARTELIREGSDSSSDNSNNNTNNNKEEEIEDVAVVSNSSLFAPLLALINIVECGDGAAAEALVSEIAPLLPSSILASLLVSICDRIKVSL